MKRNAALPPKHVLLLAPAVLLAIVAACTDTRRDDANENETQALRQADEGGDDDGDRAGDDDHGERDKAIELAIEVDNGNGIPLSVKKGQRFFLNQIDLRASLDTNVDEAVSGLDVTGDFANLDWAGTALADQQFVLLANADGTFTRQRFYRSAGWMDKHATMTIRQLDAGGHAVRPAIGYDDGIETGQTKKDDFFDRRLRAIQWTFDCNGVGNATGDCSKAKSFREEALVELRYAEKADKVFDFDPRTTTLELTWSANPGRKYTIPVTQVEHPDFGYGFKIDVRAETPPRHDGTYAPGSDITFRLTLRDGNGKRLHPKGALPTYNEVIFGANPAGIQYYRAFFDPTTTYYRRKHRERMLMSDIVGPAQDITPLRTIIDLDKFLNADDVQTTATMAVDGAYAQFRTFPTAHDLFGGAFDPAHAVWNNPVPDTWTYHLASDAAPGTYFIATKGRRVYLGQDIPSSTIVKIQVGTKQETSVKPMVGKCEDCHGGPSAFTKVLHAMPDRSACGGCHTPLGIELEGPIYVRLHFIHSRSNHFDEPKDRCTTCHLDNSTIQRTSKSACLSCHKTYPDDHIAKYGPIESMYYGGLRESFDQCSTTCHTTHPNSGL